MWWFMGAAMAADIHAKLSTGDGVNEEASWPEFETYSNKWGPVRTGKKVSTVWSLTVQPSVWDPLEGAYRVEITTCMEWTAKGKGDKHCESAEILAGAEFSSRKWTVKAHGVTHAWTLDVWYTGETPPAGLPMEEPKP